MPHCIIEYSKTLENKLSIKELVSLVHGSVFASELFDESSIKTRAIEFTHYQTGLSVSPFINITLKILQGRDHQQKKYLTKLVSDKVSEVLQPPVSLTIEVVDIEKVSYKKRVIE